MFSELTDSVRQSLLLIGTIYLLFTIAIAVILYIATFFMARMMINFSHFRGEHPVICPETGACAIVRLKALRAAVHSAVNDPELQVSDCSRWPEREGCAQECLLRAK